MNKFRFIILSTCCLLALTTQAQKIKIKTGIEVLKEQNFKCLGVAAHYPSLLFLIINQPKRGWFIL